MHELVREATLRTLSYAAPNSSRQGPAEFDEDNGAVMPRSFLAGSDPDGFGEIADRWFGDPKHGAKVLDPSWESSTFVEGRCVGSGQALW
jgi:hypothetical protein